MTPLLAIETSGELCSVAVMFDKTRYVEFNFLQKNVHSEKIINMIDQLLLTSGLSIKDIKTIAVSNGPGSFTGLRIGMTVTKSLAFGTDVPIIPVPTFQAIALQLSEFLLNGQKFIIANIVNTTELYVAKFKIVDKSIKVIEDVKVIQKSYLKEYAMDFKLLYGNYTKKELSDLPTAKFIAKWAYFFGKDLLTYNFDYLEPNYSKKFIPRINK